MSADRYGRYYWCVVTYLEGDQPKGGMWHADRAEVVGGCLLLWQDAKEDKPATLNAAYAPGAWVYFYAASVMSGEPVAQDHTF